MLAGMTANVIAEVSKINASYTDALFIPASALFMPADTAIAAQQSFVWVYDADTGSVSQRLISVKSLTSAGAAVSEGLAVGEQVVVAGVQQLVEGQKVRPWVRERGL